MNAMLLIAAHMFGDYIAQNDWQARHKFTSWQIRTLHVLLYTLCFLPVVLLNPMTWGEAGLFLGLVFVPHWLVDCRRWVPADHPWPAKAMVVDQTLHLVHLVVLTVVFGL